MNAKELYEKLGSPRSKKDLADAVEKYVSEVAELSKQERLNLLRYANSLPEFKKFWED